jgi:uncharacterized protein (DUF58 family)
MVEHTASGDNTSVYTGSGMDYEESRLYQPGDDVRFMNWRLSARTGKQYVKVFREERSPDLCILIDRRSNMRYGTASRLKVTQAAICASAAIYAAQLKMMATAALLLQRKPYWSIPGQHAGATGQLLSDIIAPCPPLNNADEPALNDGLRQCLARLVPGSILVIISDFSDADTQSSALVRQLAASHTLVVARINDPSENILQDAGQLGLTACDGSMAVDINLSDNRIRQEYEALQAQRHASINGILSGAGITGIEIETTMEKSSVVTSLLCATGLC